MRRALLLGLSILACQARPPVAVTAPPPPVPAAVELVESWPVETSLDHPDIADAADVWLDMIGSAKKTLEFGEFYASDQDGSRLHAVVEAVESAANRGVAVRFLVEETFVSKYPDTLQRFSKHAGITVRHFDRSKTMGGILHAKYFVVDGREAYLGSQNFDWRSLDHIQELGVRLRHPALVSALGATFDADWDVSGGAPETRYASVTWPTFPARDGAQSFTLGVSPQGYLPNGAAWELPILLRWIDEAKRSIRVQVLSYNTRNRDGTPFLQLDDALRRAAARGVHVHLLVSSWNEKEESLAALARVPNVEIGILTIPNWSHGEVPFARVTHAKFFVADQDRAWVGTSNWEGDYFTRSRNVGLFGEGPPFAPRVARLFDEDAASPYAKALVVAP